MAKHYSGQRVKYTDCFDRNIERTGVIQYQRVDGDGTPYYMVAPDVPYLRFEFSTEEITIEMIYDSSITEVLT